MYKVGLFEDMGDFKILDIRTCWLFKTVWSPFYIFSLSIVVTNTALKLETLQKAAGLLGPQGQNYLSLLCDPPSSPFLGLSAPTMLVSLSSLSHSMPCLPCTRPSCDWSLIHDIAFPFIFPLCFSLPSRRGAEGSCQQLSSLATALWTWFCWNAAMSTWSHAALLCSNIRMGELQQDSLTCKPKAWHGLCGP